MYKYLVALVLLTPLIGIYLVEQGEYSLSVGIGGFDAGASIAFACYALAVSVIGWWSSRIGRIETATPSQDSLIAARFKRFALRLLALEIVFLLVFLFAFGAINIWTGAVGKGPFRSELGPLGAFPFLMQKYVLPCLVAYSTLLYMRLKRPRRYRSLWLLNLLVASCIGASWGFKASAITILMPALLLMYWRIRLWTLIKMAAVVALVLITAAKQFDAESLENSDVYTFLLHRITILQGDVSWYVWSEYKDGADFPNYWPTLTAAVGDKVLTVFGVDRGNLAQWMAYHYDWMLTYISGAPLEHIVDAGYNVTATPFSEGLIAAGIPGLALISIIAGLLTGSMYRLIDNALRTNYGVRAAMFATYFSSAVFPWLNGGGVVGLIHISVLVGLGLTFVVLKWMRKIRRPEARRTKQLPPVDLPALHGA